MTDTKHRTPRAEDSIRRARDRAYELSGDPDGCVKLWEELALPHIAPELRDSARSQFRERIQDDQFRSQFVIWAYQGALRLYEEGMFD
jgi:hypothetical protein